MAGVYNEVSWRRHEKEKLGMTENELRTVVDVSSEQEL